MTQKTKLSLPYIMGLNIYFLTYLNFIHGKKNNNCSQCDVKTFEKLTLSPLPERKYQASF